MEGAVSLVIARALLRLVPERAIKGLDVVNVLLESESCDKMMPRRINPKVRTINSMICALFTP
jgi:hypothetical protein